MLSRSWSEFGINFSQNTAWDLSGREHWWDLVNFESILFLSSLILCLLKTVKYLACPSKWRFELTFWEIPFFPVPEKLHILFPISFLIFWNCVNLAYENRSLGTRIWFLIIFLPLKESLTLFQIWFFCWPWIIIVGWSSNHIFIKRVLDRTLTFRGDWWEKEDDFNQVDIAIFT